MPGSPEGAPGGPPNGGGTFAVLITSTSLEVWAQIIISIKRGWPEVVWGGDPRCRGGRGAVLARAQRCGAGPPIRRSGVHTLVTLL
eukprot:gene22784-biopygen8796